MKPKVKVKKIDENTFDVEIKFKEKTKHRISVPEDYYQDLTGGKISKEDLVKKSIGFLLERESNAQIFCEFRLPVIERHFSEYPEWVKNNL